MALTGAAALGLAILHGQQGDTGAVFRSDTRLVVC
jgi:hypothetical protein